MTGHDHLVVPFNPRKGRRIKKNTHQTVTFFLLVWGGLWYGVVPPLSRCPQEEEEEGGKGKTLGLLSQL